VLILYAIIELEKTGKGDDHSQIKGT